MADIYAMNIIFIIYFISFVNCSHYPFPSSELTALQALYNSTNGHAWLWRKPYADFGSPWNFTKDYPNPCTDSWQGVTCSSDCAASQCQVQQIILESYGLNGIIPAQFCQLYSLQLLKIDGNIRLTGLIPVEIGNMTALIQLYLADNRLSGTIPGELSNLTLLQYLDIDGNILSGTIPVELSNLSSLTVLELSNNHLRGTIPAELDNLTSLVSLFLQVNHLSGSIPIERGKLSLLANLYLEVNQLSGTIPEELGNLILLQYLDLEDNQLRGTIPVELGKLSSLRYCYLHSNELSGTIPAVMGNLTSLTNLDLVDNYLTGTLPVEFGKLPLLISLELQINHLSGTIPVELGNLTSLQYLDLEDNHLVGTLPKELGNLSSLIGLNVEINYLSGLIPMEFGKLSSLVYFYLYKNQLSGTIPEELVKLSSLAIMSFQYNFFDGSVPTSLLIHLVNLISLSLNNNLLSDGISFLSTVNHQRPPVLEEISLQDNIFSGTIPVLANLPSLYLLELQNNQLSGELVLASPSLINVDISNNSLEGCFPWYNVSSTLQLLNLSYNAFGCNLPTVSSLSSSPSLQGLVSIDLSSNQMAGSVGDFFSGMANLTTLILSNNLFSGNLYQLIDPSLQTAIKYIDISFNQLTGSLPDSLFTAASLESIVVSSNCITGSLPDTICSSSNLTSLVLDGMGSSSACQGVVSLVGGAIVNNNGLAASLPSCLFSDLPKLQTLHLSGIGLYGSLPTSLSSLPSTLQYLSLSYNYLSGSIPAVFFQHDAWKELDLSFNQITGYLADFTSLDAQLNLQINRLSGVIPSSMLQMQSINILEGNMFSCELETLSTADLPDQDPNAGSYECGSYEVDVVLLAWMSSVTAVCLSVLAWHYLYHHIHFDDMPWLMRKVDDDQAGIRSLLQSLYAWLVICLSVTCFSICVLLPLYAILKGFYHTYEDQYAWTVSSCFMKGIVPAVLLLISYQCILALLSRLAFLGKPVTKDEEAIVVSMLTVQSRLLKIDRTSVASALKLVGSVLLIIMIVIGVNGLFVLALQNQLSPAYLALLILALSLFKLGTSAILLQTSFLSSSLTPYVAMALLIFNNVIVPYIAESFVSTNCFYYATLAVSPEVSSTIEIKTCQSVINSDFNYFDTLLPHYATVCLPSTKTVTYQPPFLYGYTCSSSLITQFAAVFALRCLFSGLVQPLIKFAAGFVLLQMMRRKVAILWLHKMLGLIEGGRWKLIRLLKDAADEQEVSDLLAKTATTSIFDHRKFSTVLVADTTLLLTFGVLFPPLAIIVFISIAAHVVDHMMALSILVKLSTSSASSNSSETWAAFLARLDAEVGKTAALLYRPVLSISILAAMFWSFTLFDILGAEVGAVQASWIPVVMSVSPLLWYGFWWIVYNTQVRASCTSHTMESESGSRESKDIINPIQRNSIIEMT